MLHLSFWNTQSQSILILLLFHITWSVSPHNTLIWKWLITCWKAQKMGERKKMSSYLQSNTTGFKWSVVTINADRGRQIAPIWLCIQNSRPFSLLNISYYCLQWRRWCSLPATYGNLFLDICFYFYWFQPMFGCVCGCVFSKASAGWRIFLKTNAHTCSTDHILTTVTMSYNPSGFWILQSFTTLKQICTHIFFK